MAPTCIAAWNCLVSNALFLVLLLTSLCISLPCVLGRIMAPEDVHILIPGTAEYPASPSNRDFAV